MDDFLIPIGPLVEDEFEVWARSAMLDIHMRQGVYVSPSTQAAWIAWKGCQCRNDDRIKALLDSHAKELSRAELKYKSLRERVDHARINAPTKAIRRAIYEMIENRRSIKQHKIAEARV